MLVYQRVSWMWFLCKFPVTSHMLLDLGSQTFSMGARIAPWRLVTLSVDEFGEFKIT